MFAVLLMQVAEEASEPSKAPFYIAAGALAGFAVLLGAVGTLRHETLPPSRGASTAIMLVCAVLVAATMVTAVITG
jgi:hypothetical protein